MNQKSLSGSDIHWFFLVLCNVTIMEYSLILILSLRFSFLPWIKEISSSRTWGKDYLIYLCNSLSFQSLKICNMYFGYIAFWYYHLKWTLPYEKRKQGLHLFLLSIIVYFSLLSLKRKENWDLFFFLPFLWEWKVLCLLKKAVGNLPRAFLA